MVGRSGEGEGKGEEEGERVGLAHPQGKNREGGEGGGTSPVSPSKCGGVGGWLGGMEVLVSGGRWALGGGRGGGGIGMMDEIQPWAPRPGTPVRVQRSHVPPLGILYCIILIYNINLLPWPPRPGSPVRVQRSHVPPLGRLCYIILCHIIFRTRSHVPPLGILYYIILCRIIFRTRSHVPPLTNHYTHEPLGLVLLDGEAPQCGRRNYSPRVITGVSLERPLSSRRPGSARGMQLPDNGVLGGLISEQPDFSAPPSARRLTSAPRPRTPRVGIYIYKYIYIYIYKQGLVTNYIYIYIYIYIYKLGLVTNYIYIYIYIYIYKQGLVTNYIYIYIYIYIYKQGLVTS